MRRLVAMVLTALAACTINIDLSEPNVRLVVPLDAAGFAPPLDAGSDTSVVDATVD